MVDRFVCPVQSTDDFSFELCFQCHSFEMNLGARTSASCRKNTTLAHKRSFESAFLLNGLGLPYEVEIEAKEEPKTKL